MKHKRKGSNARPILETDFPDPGHSSSPSFGTENSPFSYEIEAFLSSQKKVWQLVADKYPYKLARLVHHDYDLSKRWYVIFYAWNVATEQIERCRLFEPINRKKTVSARLQVAQDLIYQINAELREGKVLGKQQLNNISNTAKLQVEKLTLFGAIDLFITEKRAAGRRENYLKRYEHNFKTNLQEYYKWANIEDPLIKHIVHKPDFVVGYFDYWRKKIAGKTFNNYVGDFSVLLNFLNRKKQKQLFKVSPTDMIDRQRVVKRKHAAFNDEQIKAIIQKAREKGYHQLVFFVQMIYYTLGRPNEVLAMKVRDIDLPGQRIIFKGDDAKNWRDEYVSVPPGLKKVIEESGVMKADPDHYIIGRTGKAGPTRYVTDFAFYKRFMEVIRDLEYDKINANYSPYSVKHSGVISLYLATLDMQVVKAQCRHKTIAQTDEYLRDLGLLRPSQPVLGWKGAA